MGDIVRFWVSWIQHQLRPTPVVPERSDFYLPQCTVTLVKDWEKEKDWKCKLLVPGSFLKASQASVHSRGSGL